MARHSRRQAGRDAQESDPGRGAIGARGSGREQQDPRGEGRMIKGSITVRPQAFAAAAKWAAKFIALKPAAPVQGGLLLEVDDSGLTVTAYSEHITARAYVPVEGAGEGRVVVSGRLLAELAGTFPDKEVTITGDEAAEQVTITVGRWRGTLPSMDLSEWPSLAEAPAAIGVVGGDALASLIAAVNG